MGLDDLINRDEAGSILGIDARTAHRYSDYGLLQTVQSGRKKVFRKDDVIALKAKLDARKELDANIKEIYVMNQSGVMDWQVMSEFDISDRPKIDKAIEIYRHERKRYLNKFGIDGGEHEYLILVEEAAARLKITDNHVIYDLIEEGKLEARTVEFKGRQRYFVKLQSLIDYLGDYSDKMLYRSNHAAEMLNIKIEEIDRLACSNRIGFKIKDKEPQGRYLFSSDDIRRMREISKH